MRIAHFRDIVEEAVEPHVLKDCSLVIDGQNFFYDFYEDSKLQYKFGAECDRYATYLNNYLVSFKNANIKCYFIFKGGTKYLNKKISKGLNSPLEKYHKKAFPFFGSEVCLEVLKEMNFEYFFSEYESKLDCMTLARKLSCPVLSHDIEFPLSGVLYVRKDSLAFDDGQILCKLFSLDTFLQKFKLDRNKLALFILLTDEFIFPEKTFDKFLRLRRIPLIPKYRNKILLKLISQLSEQQIVKEVLQTTEIEYELFSEKLNKVKTKVNGEVNCDLVTDYFFKRCIITDWFVDGVTRNYISKEYVDLYRSKVLFKQFHNSTDFMELSLNVIKYAYDLLTDFNNDGLKVIRFCYELHTEQTTFIKESIKRPTPQDQAIFKGDWDNILSLRLFQHFILETISFDCGKLEMFPDEAKMLIVTLLYIFHISKLQPNITTFTNEMAYGVLLSYVMLGPVKEHVDNINSDNSVTIPDCESALHLLEDYFIVNDVEKIMEMDLYTSLKQFQYCLLQMNNLNKLCGSCFKPTSYKRTYNGTFVYNVIYNMKNEGIIKCVNNILSCAPTVLQYYCNIIELYNSLLQSE